MFTTRNSRKKAAAAVVALAAFGGLTASAASLGGLNSSSLGASATVVASCDTDGIAISYPSANVAWDSVSNDYRNSAVLISGVNDNCAGKAFRLTLSTNTASLTEQTGTVTLGTGASAGTQTITLAAPVKAQDVTRASLVITG